MTLVQQPIRVAPSLLAADFARLAEAIQAVESAGADVLHVDVMDGHFVPNLTIGPPVVAAMAKVATQPLDVHMMVADPWRWADAFCDAGAHSVSFHLEVARRGDGLALLEQLRSRDVLAGMAINPDADVADLAPYLPHLDHILVMSVFPGFGGQAFIPEVLDGVRRLRGEFGYEHSIAIDGGIDLETIGPAAAAGIDTFVAGTAVFGAEDVAARITALRHRAEAGRSDPS